MKKIKIWVFKETGKWYTEEDFEIPEQITEVPQAVDYVLSSFKAYPGMYLVMLFTELKHGYPHMIPYWKRMVTGNTAGELDGEFSESLEETKAENGKIEGVEILRTGLESTSKTKIKEAVTAKEIRIWVFEESGRLYTEGKLKVPDQIIDVWQAVEYLLENFKAYPGMHLVMPFAELRYGYPSIPAWKRIFTDGTDKELVSDFPQCLNKVKAENGEEQCRV